MAFNVRPAIYTEVLPVASTVKSGDAVRVGAFFGVAEIDAHLGDDGLYYSTVALEGIVHLPFGTATAAVGDVLYVTVDDALAKTAGVSPIVNKPIGVVRVAKGNTDGDVWFRLTPSTVIPA